MSATLVCDPRRLFAQAFASYLRHHGVEDVHVVPGTAVEVIDFLEWPFATVVLSICPDSDGLKDLSRLREHRPNYRIVALTASDDAEDPWSYLAAGADVVTSRLEPLEVMAAQVPGFSGPARKPFSTGLTSTPGPPVAPYTKFLTPRQREVLDLIVTAHSTEQIAAQLGITPATARGYVQTVLEKLGVHSRLEAVVLAGQAYWEAPRESWCS